MLQEIFLNKLYLPKVVVPWSFDLLKNVTKQKKKKTQKKQSTCRILHNVKNPED